MAIPTKYYNLTVSIELLDKHSRPNLRMIHCNQESENDIHFEDIDGEIHVGFEELQMVMAFMAETMALWRKIVMTNEVLEAEARDDEEEDEV